LDENTNFGTIASASQLDRIQSFILKARQEGATAVLEGATWGETSMSPAIFADVRSDMQVACEEVFGPVLAVMRFSHFDEALELANKTEYGLTDNLWTRDLRRTHAGIRGLRAGRITIRASAAAGEHSGFALGQEPWGASGFGAEGGLEGLRTYCRAKAVEVVS
jgi:acyl-CoA reductase-like NAD-dependent aldehyde dehydrogenase